MGKYGTCKKWKIKEMPQFKPMLAINEVRSTKQTFFKCNFQKRWTDANISPQIACGFLKDLYMLHWNIQQSEKNIKLELNCRNIGND